MMPHTVRQQDSREMHIFGFESNNHTRDVHSQECIRDSKGASAELNQALSPNPHLMVQETSTVIVPWTMPFFLDHICSLDKFEDEARSEKIENIKKALADGTYHVSAAGVARKILDCMREP
jgi:hypothetical protein